MRVQKTCSECGSTDIYGYTTIYWDVEQQQWEVTDDISLAEFFCADCGEQCRVKTTPVVEEDEHGRDEKLPDHSAAH